MGQCLSSNQPSRNNHQPTLSPPPTSPSNPNNKHSLIYTPAKSPPQSTASGGSSKVDSIVTIQDALKNQEIPGNNSEEKTVEQEHNTRTTSSIIFRPKKGKKAVQKPKEVPVNRSLIKDFENCAELEGELETSDMVEKVTITNREIDIEFMLSRSTAGPLVVPYIAFDQYSTV